MAGAAVNATRAKAVTSTVIRRMVVPFIDVDPRLPVITHQEAQRFASI